MGLEKSQTSVLNVSCSSQYFCHLGSTEAKSYLSKIIIPLLYLMRKTAGITLFEASSAPAYLYAVAQNIVYLVFGVGAVGAYPPVEEQENEQSR